MDITDTHIIPVIDEHGRRHTAHLRYNVVKFDSISDGYTKTVRGSPYWILDDGSRMSVSGSSEFRFNIERNGTLVGANIYMD